MSEEEKSLFGNFCIFCTMGAIAVTSVIVLAVLIWVLLL